MDPTAPAAPTNPAGRPNQQRYSTVHPGTTKQTPEPVQHCTKSLRTITEQPEPSASDADIFGEFFEAPETADTINQRRGDAQSGGAPAFAPMEVEAELDYFLNEPSPPTLRNPSATPTMAQPEIETETGGLVDL